MNKKDAEKLEEIALYMAEQHNRLVRLVFLTLVIACIALGSAILALSK